MERSAWDHLRPDLILRLRAQLPLVAAEITEAVAAEVPAYAGPIEGALGERLREGVLRGLSRFLDVGDGADPALGPREQHFYRTLGSGELQAHRDLQTLLAAYRVGTRVAFRRLATALATQPDLPHQAIIALAEALFAYMDEVSATSAQGYADEQSLRAGEHERLRQELLALILSAGADLPTLTSASVAAGWPLPSSVVAIMTPRDLAATRVLHLGSDALVGLYQATTVAVLAAPADEAHRHLLARAVAGGGAAISPVCPPAQLHSVLELTHLTCQLTQERVLIADPAYVDEHLAELILHRDRLLTEALIASRLQPLDKVKAGSRARLAETLLSWLQHRGERRRIAAELHVHPQTVGYRLTQLRALFGADLDDPTARFELEMALRAALPRNGEEASFSPVG